MHPVLEERPTLEGGQLGGVGGDEAGGYAAPVAAANDGDPVLGVAVLHIRRRRQMKQWSRGNQEQCGE
jgi:hypothetical protein